VADLLAQVEALDPELAAAGPELDEMRPRSLAGLDSGRTVSSTRHESLW
jgi:hypothetical protein